MHFRIPVRADHVLRVLLGLALAGTTLAVAASIACAQDRAFLFTLTPARGMAAHGVVSGDLGYGERLFRALGPEQSEQAVQAQVSLGSRWTLMARTAIAPGDPSATSKVSAQAELTANLLAGRGTRVFVGGGALRDYEGTPVLTARIGADWRRTAWLAAGNVRFEHALDRDGATGLRHDDLDVITSAGASRRVGAAMRVGVELVGEDLEGLLDEEEAEGGAKLMVGPTMSWAPEAARWELLAGAGPVVRLSNSTSAPRAASLPRDLSTRSGYVVRAAIGYRW